MKVEGGASTRQKISGLYQLSRPFTLIAPVSGVFAGGIMAMAFYGRLDLFAPSHGWFWILIGASLLFALINSASNAFNQVYDLDIDAINKPTRPIPSGIVTVREAMTFSLALYALALFFAALLNPLYLLFTGTFVAITVLYSIPPFRLKKRLWISNLSIGVARSWMLLLSGWCIFPFANPMEPTIWFIGLVMFVFLFGSSATKDFTDIPGDKRYDMQTLPVVFGPKRAIDIIAPFFIVPFILIPVGIMLDLLPLVSLYLVPFALWGTYIAITFKDAAKRNSFENSPVWVHMYLMLIALQLGFCTVCVL